MPGDESLIIVMRADASTDDVEHILERLSEIGAEAHVSEGTPRTVIGIIGDRIRVQQLPWEAFPGVERAVPVLKAFKFVSRDFQPHDSIVEVGSARVGGGNFASIAGPCAVESRDQLFASAEAVMKAGARQECNELPLWRKPPMPVRRESSQSMGRLSMAGLTPSTERLEVGIWFIADARASARTPKGSAEVQT